MIFATYKVTSEPAIEPVSLADLKRRLRVTACDFDDELNDLISAGRKIVEVDAKLKLITQTVELSLDQFPSKATIEIRQLPVQSVTSITYTDEDQTTQTFSNSLYNVDTDGKPVRILLKENEDWEDTEPQWPQAVKVTYTAGYGATVASVPVEARLAIVEWCRMHWGKCDGSRMRYDNLISAIAWTGYGKAA